VASSAKVVRPALGRRRYTLVLLARCPFAARWSLISTLRSPSRDRWGYHYSLVAHIQVRGGADLRRADGLHIVAHHHDAVLCRVCSRAR